MKKIKMKFKIGDKIIVRIPGHEHFKSRIRIIDGDCYFVDYKANQGLLAVHRKHAHPLSADFKFSRKTLSYNRK